MSDEYEVCKICGLPDRDIKSNHLREVYYFKNQDKFDRSLFVPRLNFLETSRLLSGSNSICSNRTICRKERLRSKKPNEQTKRSTNNG